MSLENARKGNTQLCFGKRAPSCEEISVIICVGWSSVLKAKTLFKMVKIWWRLEQLDPEKQKEMDLIQ